jgi:hypothetical protein
MLDNSNDVVTDGGSLAGFTVDPGSNSAEHIQFFVGAANAAVLALLFWAAIGIGVYELTSS